MQIPKFGKLNKVATEFKQGLLSLTYFPVPDKYNNILATLDGKTITLPAWDPKDSRGDVALGLEEGLNGDTYLVESPYKVAPVAPEKYKDYAMFVGLYKTLNYPSLKGLNRTDYIYFDTNKIPFIVRTNLVASGVASLEFTVTVLGPFGYVSDRKIYMGGCYTAPSITIPFDNSEHDSGGIKYKFKYDSSPSLIGVEASKSGKKACAQYSMRRDKSSAGWMVPPNEILNEDPSKNRLPSRKIEVMYSLAYAVEISLSGVIPVVYEYQENTPYFEGEFVYRLGKIYRCDVSGTSGFPGLHFEENPYTPKNIPIHPNVSISTLYTPSNVVTYGKHVTTNGGGTTEYVDETLHVKYATSGSSSDLKEFKVVSRIGYSYSDENRVVIETYDKRFYNSATYVFFESFGDSTEITWTRRRAYKKGNGEIVFPGDPDYYEGAKGFLEEHGEYSATTNYTSNASFFSSYSDRTALFSNGFLVGDYSEYSENFSSVRDPSSYVFDLPIPAEAIYYETISGADPDLSSYTTTRIDPAPFYGANLSLGTIPGLSTPVDTHSHTKNGNILLESQGRYNRAKIFSVSLSNNCFGTGIFEYLLPDFNYGEGVETFEMNNVRGIEGSPIRRVSTGAPYGFSWDDVGWYLNGTYHPKTFKIEAGYRIANGKYILPDIYKNFF
jgi:hypothetical protein